MRRAEFIGEKNGVRFYDDYAHHPHEVAQVISAYREWFPTNRLVVAFQSHTFSRTKSLFSDFVGAFDQASEVCMLDIFPSAREAFDSSVTSDMLCDAIQQRVPTLEARNYGTLSKLAEHLRATLKPGDVCLTVGAGDIYQVHTWL
jgi:UDP-N-acetylmuramate--alanine ligase